MKLELSNLTTNRKYQVRLTGVDDDTVRQYAEAMEEGATFPPLTVFRTEDAHILVDGWHRYRAATSLGWTHFEATIIEGTEDEAYHYSRFVTNRTNGQRLSRADLQALCEEVVSDPNLNTKSDRELAKMVGVSHPMVASARKRVGVIPTKRMGADGKVRALQLEKFSSSSLIINTSPPPAGPECPPHFGQESLVAALAARLEENLVALDVSLGRLSEYGGFLSDTQRRHILRVTNTVMDKLDNA
jgi:hypothetical protein